MRPLSESLRAGFSFVAELDDRMAWEAGLSRELSRLLRSQMGQLLELLGDPPDLNNIPESFWQDAGEELQAALSRNFQDIYLAAAEQILDAQPIGVDWGLVNSNAANWARQYSFDLVSGITQTSRQAVSDAIAAFFEEQQTLQQLRDRLSSIYGPVRADMIASTEVTRAAVQGERSVIAEIEAEGVQMQRFWITSQDELVCPICSPLHERPYSEWSFQFPDGPPGHPRCRCSEAHEFVTVGERIG